MCYNEGSTRAVGTGTERPSDGQRGKGGMCGDSGADGSAGRKRPRARRIGASSRAGKRLLRCDAPEATNLVLVAKSTMTLYF